MSEQGWARNAGKTGGQDRVEKMWNDIYYGNGKSGLTTRMNDVEKDIKLIQEREDRRSKKQDRIELAVWAAVIMEIANFIFSHIH